MTVLSKMSTENIFREMYEKALYWEQYGGKPHRVKNNSISNIEVWLASKGMPMSYEIFEYMLKDVLKLSSQHRVIRETWLYLLRQEYIVEKEVNKNTKTLTLNLVEVREILGIEDGYEELRRIRGYSSPISDKGDEVKT